MLRAGTYRAWRAARRNSPALLLRSANSAHPNGLANGSGLVGRNYMAHINSTLIAIDPTRRNSDVFSKTIAVNDFYFGSDRVSHTRWATCRCSARSRPAATSPARTRSSARHSRAEMRAHSADWWVMSEDLPDPENRVMLGSDGGIRVRRRFKNMRTHTQLVAHAEAMLRAVGYSEIIHTLMPVETNSHQCGTLRFGD